MDEGPGQDYRRRQARAPSVRFAPLGFVQLAAIQLRIIFVHAAERLKTDQFRKAMMRYLAAYLAVEISLQ
jgi:hypothetical protein